MKIHGLIWLPNIIEKLDVKHGVRVEEVEEVFIERPLFRRGPRGNRPGENLYKAMVSPRQAGIFSWYLSTNVISVH